MVRAKTLQVVWHSQEPVYSVDFHPNGQLVTGGADKEVKVWEVARGEDGYATVRHVSSLTAHLSTVNCVRFSPTGAYLASSGDGGEVLLWEPAADAGAGGAAPAPRGNLCEDEGEASWRRTAALKGHSAQSDVMDLCWAPDGSALATGAIDNEVILFAASGKRRGDAAARFRDHRHFVQGVAWDPAQQFVVTQSADRTCRVYTLKPPAGGRKSRVSQYLLPATDTARDLYCSHTLSKRPMAAGAQGGEPGAKPAAHPLFADERVPTFFRRPAWSPDGSMLVVPAGLYKATAEGRELNTAHVYARGRWGSPIMHLPGHPKPIVAVRFCPVLFRRDDAGQQQPQQPQQADAAAQQQQQQGGQGGQGDQGDKGAATHPFDLPYKMVFAVATLDSVVVYDSQGALPLAVLGGLHYDSLTDLAWSSDGAFLAISSRDCYCSIATFEAGELGTPLPLDQLPPHIAKRVASAQRVREPLPVPAPAAGRSGAVGAAKAAATPTAQAPATVNKPAVGAATTAAPGSAAAAPGGTVQKPEQEGAAAAAAAAGRKRIQPEPISAAPAPAPNTAAAAAAAPASAEQPATKKPKRIVPESVGPAHAVVGDSQQGGAEPSSYPEPAAPSAAKHGRRIVPEAMGGSSGAAASGGAGALKAPRRIVAEPVGPPAAPASAAKSSGLPAESAASLGRAAKRITPTPLRRLDSGQQFGAAHQQSAQPAPSELSRDGCPPASARRITPVPVARPQALPPGEERTASVAPKPSGGIAALAAMAGAQAAQARQQ